MQCQKERPEQALAPSCRKNLGAGAPKISLAKCRIHGVMSHHAELSQAIVMPPLH